MGELQENGTFLNDDSEITVTEVVASTTQNISNAEFSLVEDEIENSAKWPSKYQKTIPAKIKREVGIYADSFGAASAIKKFTSLLRSITNTLSTEQL